MCFPPGCGCGICPCCRECSLKAERACLTLCLKIIAPILFMLGFLEMVGLGLYIDTMWGSESSACCGIISSSYNVNDTSYIAGAVCAETQITNAIDHVNDTNRNIWCSVNGTKCDSKTLNDGTSVTLNDCFDEAGHNVSTLCSAKALQLQSENASVCSQRTFLFANTINTDEHTIYKHTK